MVHRLSRLLGCGGTVLGPVLVSGVRSEKSRNVAIAFVVLWMEMIFLLTRLTPRQLPIRVGHPHQVSVSPCACAAAQVLIECLAWPTIASVARIAWYPCGAVRRQPDCIASLLIAMCMR